MTLTVVRGERTVRFGAGRHRVRDRHDRRACRALRDTLARCVAAARRAGGGRRSARDGSRASVSRLNPTAVREWARAQGIEVNDRGRVRAELVARLKAAIAT